MGHVRAEWHQLPLPLRADLERYFGSRVVSAENQEGGFSPGLAARVRCADGTRAFVKAVGSALNPDTPRMFRAERRVASALPESVPAAPLRYAYDDGDWVALVFDEIDGATPPVPWRERDLARALAALRTLGGTATPSPVPGLPRIADTLAQDMAAYGRIATDPPADLHPWEATHLEDLLELTLTAPAALDGASLVHMDVRADNMLLTPDGRVVLVDWGWAGAGPPWFDTLTLLLNTAVDGLDPAAQDSPVLAAADPAHVDAVLAGLAGMWSESCRKPPPPGLPTVRAFQRRYYEASLAWLRRRTG